MKKPKQSWKSGFRSNELLQRNEADPSFITGRFHNMGDGFSKFCRGKATVV